jgi:hypothetical protein
MHLTTRKIKHEHKRYMSTYKGYSKWCFVAGRDGRSTMYRQARGVWRPMLVAVGTDGGAGRREKRAGAYGALRSCGLGAHEPKGAHADGGAQFGGVDQTVAERGTACQ